MDIEKYQNRLKQEDGLSKTLGMEFISTPEPDTLEARMKVDKRNRQVFGFLSGGATLALAENLAGVGSMAACPGKICVGINVSGNHVRAVLEGDTVTAHGQLLHKGGKLHVWLVNITNSEGELISTVHVTNYVISTKGGKIRPARPTTQKDE
jgi:1,4-dihydroxy-2-naphthoyl-CoA hydrolase